MKIRYILLIALLVALVLTSTHRPQDGEKDTIDGQMPRSRSFVSMETGDAEYLSLTAAVEASDPEEVGIQEVAAAGNEAVTIGIHGEDQEENPYVQSAIGCLTRSKGVFDGPSGREKWYNLPMSGVVEIMRSKGYDEIYYPYWIREDGVKMLGDYVMIAANTELRPKGSILETSLGKGIVCDHCAEAMTDYTLIDIAVDW